MPTGVRGGRSLPPTGVRGRRTWVAGGCTRRIRVQPSCRSDRIHQPLTGVPVRPVYPPRWAFRVRAGYGEYGGLWARVHRWAGWPLTGAHGRSLGAHQWAVAAHAAAHPAGGFGGGRGRWVPTGVAERPLSAQARSGLLTDAHRVLTGVQAAARRLGVRWGMAVLKTWSTPVR